MNREDRKQSFFCYINSLESPYFFYTGLTKKSLTTCTSSVKRVYRKQVSMPNTRIQEKLVLFVDPTAVLFCQALLLERALPRCHTEKDKKEK